MSGNLAHAMNHTAYYRVRTGRSAYGDPSWGAWIAFKCRYQTGHEIDRFRLERGNDLRQESVIYTYTAIPEGAQVSPPGPTAGTTSAWVAHQVKQSPARSGAYTLYMVRLSNQETV